jgi:hypothetical protein
MQALTVSVSCTAPADVVYAFASNPQNLPRWAAGLCKSVAQFDGRWIVESPMGTLDFEFTPANRFGVLDHRVVLESGETFDNPMRVIANGEGSEILFTLFRQPAMSAADFERDSGLVRADLETLARAVEAL